MGLLGEGRDPGSGVEQLNELGLLGVEQVEYSVEREKNKGYNQIKTSTTRITYADLDTPFPSVTYLTFAIR